MGRGRERENDGERERKKDGERDLPSTFSFLSLKQVPLLTCIKCVQEQGVKQLSPKDLILFPSQVTPFQLNFHVGSNQRSSITFFFFQLLFIIPNHLCSLYSFTNFNYLTTFFTFISKIQLRVDHSSLIFEGCV